MGKVKTEKDFICYCNYSLIPVWTRTVTEGDLYPKNPYPTWDVHEQAQMLSMQLMICIPGYRDLELLLVLQLNTSNHPIKLEGF